MTIEPSGRTGPGPFRRSPPAQLSSFVGRQRELADLDVLLAENRLVTLTGPGGGGKTRLALEFAVRHLDQLADAVFIDLAPITDPGLVASSIAAALGIRQEPRLSLLDTLVERLAERRLLLILDNVEQLPGAGPIVAELLGRCPHLRVLATSRSHLHVRGEHEYTVDPLGLPEHADLESPARLGRTEAVELFVDRARLVDTHFALTVENSTAIAEICRRLDGLPLAIELAAARSKILAPDALLRRLEHRLAVLSGGASDAPARQRTLRDTIAWSYDLLESSERMTFARLSVFVAGFTLGAANAVTPDPADPPDPGLIESLGLLVAHNLLRVNPGRDGDPRFRLLETIRAFALEQLGEEAEGLQARHAAHFATFAEAAVQEIGGRDHVSWLEQATEELDNLRAALEWASVGGHGALLVRLATAVSQIFIERGDHREAGRWLQAAEEVAPRAELQLRAGLLYQLARYEIAYVGDRARIEQLFSEALDLYESIGDTAGMARALLYLAEVAGDLGDSATATARLERARELIRDVADPRAAARLMGMLAAAAPIILGRPEPTLAREAVAIGVEIGDRPTIAWGLVAVGMTALATGDALGALAALSEAVEIWGELGDRAMHAFGLAAQGTAHLRAGDLDAARLLLREAAVFRDAPRYVGISALEGAADWLGAIGRAEQATTCWSAVDAAKAASLDRTFPIAPEFFTPSRERDRSALRPAKFDAARATGQAMTLEQALDYAVLALDQPIDSSTGRGAAPTRRGRYDLTRREQEVLELLAAGRPDGDIAAALYISKKTAAVHVANIKGKLGADSRVEIVTIAMRHGLVLTPGQARPPAR